MRPNDDALVEKVRKLLALASSTNEHEATLAAEKAQKLMLRHNIAASEVAFEDGTSAAVGEASVETGGGVWRRTLAQALAASHDCRLIWCRLGVRRAAITFVGPRGGVAGVAETFRFLETTLLTLSAAATAGAPGDDAAASRLEFLDGAAERVGGRLEDHREAILATLGSEVGRGLVLYEGAVDDYVDANYELVRGTPPPEVARTSAWRQGWVAGGEVWIGQRQLDA